MVHRSWYNESDVDDMTDIVISISISNCKLLFLVMNKETISLLHTKGSTEAPFLHKNKIEIQLLIKWEI